MTKTHAKGIQRHPIFKLGKEPARRDSRNLKLKTILRAPVKVPSEYDFDTSHSGVPTPVFANDRVGDCVIAGRALFSRPAVPMKGSSCSIR